MDRFEVLGELGHGGMAVVLEVVDTATGNHLALKALLPSRTTPELVERFAREFETLAHLSHPNVLQVLEKGMWGDRPYYVMEYLRGHELKDVVESWRELSPQERFRRAEKLLVQIARALEHIHRRGLVHRDVTPSNIFVLDDGTAKLMDFGVVHDPGIEAADEEMVGTVAYMAPEQITSARVDARADLYSLGAVLYLMLTGRRPFNSRTLAGYLDKHLHQAVKPPRTLHPTLPEKLDRICLSLLEKNPDDRIASATHLLRLLEGEPHVQGALGDLPLVGRARELSQIREVVGGLVAGRGAVVVVEGGAGLGKGRMATEVVGQAEHAGIVVHRASNAAPDQRAFDGYRPIYRELRAGIRDRLAHPALEATFGAGDPSADVYDRRIVLEEMRKLAAAVGPRLVVIDNLDLADAATIDLTEYLVRNLVGVDKAPFVLVLTRQTTTDLMVDPLTPLVAGTSTGVVPLRLTLGPISVSAVEELLLSVVQDDPRVSRLAARLQEEGSGNPYVITEMVESLVQEGFVIPGPGGELGHLKPGAFEGAADALPVPRTIRELWRARIAPVSDAALQVLRTLAAAPEPLDLELVEAGSALPHHEIERGIDELLAKALCRLHDGQDEDHYELGLARLRDVLIEDADSAVMAAIHQRLGAKLERRHRKSLGAALEILAFHFERARVPAKAYQYLLSSAERQLSRGYRREALELLDRALAVEDAARVALLLEDADRLLAEGLLSRAKALHHLGRWDEAEATAARAEATALELGHDWLLSKVLATRAEILRFTRGGDVARELARQALEKAKNAADPKLEIEPLFDLGGLAWERGELDQARQYWLEGLAKAQSLSLEALAARGYGGLGIVAICRGQIVEARRYLEQAYETCDRLGLVEALAVTGCNLVELHHFSGNLRKGLDLADRVVARTREVQYPFGTALGLRYRALMLVDLGQLGEADETAREALRIVEALGDDHTRFETLVVLVRVALANEELDEASRLLVIATRLGSSDTEGFVPLLHAWSARLAAIRGDADAARLDLARAEERIEGAWPHQRVRLLLNIARVHEVLGEHMRARDRADAALRLSDSNGFRYYAMRARQILARVSREDAVVARHARVADALARSLAANLPEDEARQFLELQSRVPGS